MATSQQLYSIYQQTWANEPKMDDSGSYYDQSFVDRIAEAQRNIDTLVNEQNQADAKRQQAHDEYDTFSGNMKNYSSLNDEAEDRFGVQTAIDEYEKSKFAVAATEQTLDALPSSINRNSNVVMSQSRRELAYNAAANKWEQNMRTKQAVVDVNKETWDKAREMSGEYAMRLYSEQENQANRLALFWNTQTNAFNEAVKKVQDAKSFKMSLESDYRSWQHQQQQDAWRRWFAQQQDAWNNYWYAYQRESQDRIDRYNAQIAASEQRIRESRERLAQSLVNSYHRTQQIKKEAEIANAGGIIGRAAYILNHY